MLRDLFPDLFDAQNSTKVLKYYLVLEQRLWQTSVTRFDTFEFDSTSLEVFLRKGVREGDLVVMMTSDEASRNLSPEAKEAIAALG